MDKDNDENGRIEEENDEKNKKPKNGNESSRDDAGPSTTDDLPGSIDNSNNSHFIKGGISKSEHCIRQVTYKDVSNALRLTSFSFGPVNPNSLGNTKIPPGNQRQIESEHVTLDELNKFVTSCYKINKEGRLNDQPKITIPSTEEIVPSNVLENTANGSALNNTQNVNEVTKSPPKLDTFEPKPVVNKKKTSGSISEKSEFGVGQKDSLSSIGSNVCRICMTKGRERLISPCNCKGSLANVHLTCLERWLNQVGRNHCELCGYSYPAIRTPRYTVLQALRLWFGNPRNRGHLQSDCLIFWLLSTVTAGLLAVCVVGTQYFVFEGTNYNKHGTRRKSEGISHRITETAMDFFMAIVLCGYSVTVYLLWKDHFVMWNRWRRANVNVRLLLTPDSNPVPFVPRPRYSIV